MTDETVHLRPPRKGRRWVRTLAWGLGIVIILLVAVYLVGTSSAFFKGAILPRIAKAIHAEVTVSEASIRPFSQITLRDLRIQTTGADPLLTAPEVLVRYHLMDMIGGHINVDEVRLSAPTVVLVENPDHTSNLDPILNSQKPASTEKRNEAPSGGKPSKPLQVDLKRFILNDGTIRQLKLYPGGKRDTTELAHLNLSVSDVKNGQAGKMTLGTDIKVENNPPAPVANGSLEGKANGGFDFTLTPDLKPATAKGNIHLEISKAEGGLAQLSTLAGDLDGELTPTELKQLALRFQKGGTPLGELLVSGPYDLTKKEGRFKVEIRSIDKQLLNLAGAKNGIDFGTTTFNSTNQVEWTKSGSVVIAAGDLDISQFQVTRTNQTTPPLDLHAQYNVTVDLSQSNALLNALTITGTQRGNPLLEAKLGSPMNLAWGDITTGVGDSTLSLGLTRLDLADWKPFLGAFTPAGTVSAQMRLVSQQSGKQLTFDLNSQADNLEVVLGTNRLTRCGVALQANGQTVQFKRFALTGYKLQLSRNSQALVSLSGSGTYDSATTNADLQVAVQAALARVLEVMPQPEVGISTGTLDLKGHLTQNQRNERFTGNLALTDFTGHFGKTTFQNFGSTMELDLGMTPALVQIQKAMGHLTQAGKPGGSFDLAGSYDLTSKATQLRTKLADFNVNGLRSFLEPLLPEQKLVSVALNANATVQYAPQGRSSIKGDLQVTNLVVNDSRNQIPATPLDVRLRCDASLANNVTDVSQLQLGLTPTSRAANEINVTGQLDRSRTNATQGHLKLAADALDLTRYYELLARPPQPNPNVASNRSSPNKPAVAPAGPEKEPEATKLPFENFVAEVNIGRLYLREIQLTHFQATTKIDGGHILLKPFQFALNAGAVAATADLDLGVAGYKYDTAFQAKNVPLAPLVDSFQPDRKGQLGGTFTAQTKLTGQGMTGASLQKYLNGQFDFTSTNLNLAVINVKSPLLKTTINVVATIPELVRDPVGTVGGLLTGLISKSAPKGGLAEDLQKSPVNSISAHGNVAGGRLNLQQADVQSSAFRADASGAILLAAVLTNSTIKIPVKVSLSRPIAERINLVPANTPTNATYAKLPDFLTLEGTLGDPKPNVNKVALSGVALKGIAGAIPGSTSTGNIVQGIGALLTGESGTTNAASRTNPPSATGLLQGLGGLLGGVAGQTNQASTNQPTNNLLNDLLGPRKK